LLVLPLAGAVLFLQVEQAAAGALERAMLGKSQVVDLTHALDERVLSQTLDPRPLPAPVPSSVPPVVGQERPRNEATGEADRISATARSSAPADLTTQLELPMTVEMGKATVAQIPARELFIHAVLVDVSSKVAKTDDYRVTADDLRAWERTFGRIPKGSVVLLHTGWSRRWGDPVRYLNLDAQGVPRVPGFSLAALDFLVSERGVRGVGLDAFFHNGTLGSRDETPRALSHAGRWQLANLTNLNLLPAKGAKLVIAPLRLEAGSAPVRVIAILP
jgi:kynurenine formamidase